MSCLIRTQRRLNKTLVNSVYVMDHSRPLFLYLRLFYKQLTVNNCWTKRPRLSTVPQPSYVLIIKHFNNHAKSFSCRGKVMNEQCEILIPRCIHLWVFRHLLFVKNYNLLWQKFYAIGQITIVENGQIWNIQPSHPVTLPMSLNKVVNGSRSSTVTRPSPTTRLCHQSRCKRLEARSPGGRPPSPSPSQPPSWTRTSPII